VSGSRSTAASLVKYSVGLIPNPTRMSSAGPPPQGIHRVAKSIMRFVSGQPRVDARVSVVVLNGVPFVDESDVQVVVLPREKNHAQRLAITGRTDITRRRSEY
jgi:hypothetical protein